MIYTKDKEKILTMRLSQFDYDKLKKIADKYNISVSLLIRNILISYLNKE